MKKVIAIFALIIMASCSQKVVDVKSPCVSTDDGPCGPKMPINQWWMDKSTNS